MSESTSTHSETEKALPTSAGPEKKLEILQEYFSRPVAQRATKPLRDGIEIAVHVGESGPFSLCKKGGEIVVLSNSPRKPDMTFRVSEKGLGQLAAHHTEDIGEVGVEILKLMVHSDPDYRLTAKVHIGLFDLLRNGYLSVLPLGGPSVMKFLAGKGFTGMGKIKDALSRLRS